jgi:hypothetical protein
MAFLGYPPTALKFFKQLKKNNLISLKNNLLFKAQQLIKHKSRIKIVHPKRKPRQMLDSLKK